MFSFLSKILRYSGSFLLVFLSFSTLASNLKTYNLEIMTNHGPLKFLAHTSSDDKDYVGRVFAILKEDAPRLVDYFQYAPSEITHIVLDEEATIANGSATVFPANVIELFTTSPRALEHLSRNNDPIRALVIHEFTHILHLDQTTGFLDIIKSIFGSIGKLGGLTPRWFSEGIGTWAESHFTDYGRLKNDLMKSELAAKMLNSNFCQNIDCLDAPGQYPHGQYAYWIGGFFMEHLENKKSGTINCLIKENSANFAFMLNHAFYNCLGENAQNSFLKFTEEFKNQYGEKRNYSDLERIVLPEEFPVWQSSFEVINDEIFFISKDDKDYYQNILSKNQHHKKKAKFDIEQYEKATKYTKESGALILSALKERRLESSRLALYEKNNEIIKEGEFKYFFEVEKERFITFSFEDNQWIIRDGQDEIYRDAPFTHFEQINPIEIGGDHFFILRANFLNGANEEINEWKLFSLKNKSMIPLHISNSRFLYACDEKIILQGSETEIIDLKIMKLLTGPSPEWMSEVIEMRGDKGNAYMILKSDPSALYVKKNFCNSFNSFTPSEDGREILNFSKSDFKEEISKEENYRPYLYFKPHYWMFNALVGSDTLDYYSVLTSINDPLDRHEVSLNISYYSDVEKVAPSISYTFNPDDYWARLSYQKSFSKNSFSRQANSDEEYSFKMGREYEFTHFDLTPGMRISLDESEDFFSKSSGQEYGVFLEGILREYLENDLFKSGLFYTTAYERRVKGHKAYKGYEGLASITLSPFSHINLLLRGSYGQLDKKSFQAGLLYGGGYSNEMHSFYGLDYSDLFGNRIWTTRAEIFTNIFRPYRGYDLFPAFVKEVDLILGTDYAKSDFIAIKNTLKRNDTVQSYYLGARFKALVAYLAPVDIDLLFTTIDDDRAGKVNSSLLILNSSFF